MKKKIMLLILCAILLASAEAQETKKIPRIGYVSSGDPSTQPLLEAFRRGLRDLGYVEGKNIQVEYRYAEGKQNEVPGLVTDLVQLKVDALVIGYLPAIYAAKQATKTIPIVMVTPVDPVASGIVNSLARPGGNITGVTRLTRDLKNKGWNCSRRWSPGYHVSEFSGMRAMKTRVLRSKNTRLRRRL
jgi:putative tryptophan/tyrosine transport system substrate-binding protein